MYEFGAQLSAIELIPWESGTFEVSLNGRLIHSMKRDGGFPEHGVIGSAVRAALKAV
jgi:selenoprotein W-related protein